MAELTCKEEIREAVRERYAAAATSVGEGRVACCAPSTTSEAGQSSCGCGTDVPDACGGEEFGAGLYLQTDRDALPDEAKLASLGCGNRRQSPSSTRARRSWISALAEASTSCCPLAELGRPARLMAST